MRCTTRRIPTIRQPAAGFMRRSSALKTAFLFPGQGLQYVQMGKALAEHFPAAREVFQKADKALGYCISEICFRPPSNPKHDLLGETSFTQPAVFVTSLAYLRVVQDLLKTDAPQFVAGHSLGEYTALVAAGVLSFEEGLSLIARRAEAMQSAAEKRAGTMAALLGMDDAAISSVVQGASGADVLCVALENSPVNTVISGDKAAVERAAGIARKRARILPVSGAFHSPLMAAAQAALGPALAQAHIAQPRIPYIANATGEPVVSAADVAPLLLEQMQRPVRWRKTVQSLWESGVRRFLEIGPGVGIARMVSENLAVLNTAGETTVVWSSDSGDKSGGLAPLPPA